MSEHCFDCSEEYFSFGVYNVSDELWAELVPEWAPGGLLCPRCLEKRAEAKGRTLYWNGALDDFPVVALEKAIRAADGVLKSKRAKQIGYADMERVNARKLLRDALRSTPATESEKETEG
jgi:hypothetical protein